MSGLRIGIIGCGYWGPNLLRNFLKADGCEVVAVADLDASRLAPLSRIYPHLRATTRPDELLEDPGVDAVAIATPISTHHALARQALQRGKHVLVEKPMAETSMEADDLVRLAHARERILMVDHTFVYSGAVRKIRALIDGHELGDLLYVDSVRVNLGLVQRDMNVLWDLAPHDFSIICHLVDQPPVSVSAVAGCPIVYEDRQIEGLAYVTIMFPRGLIAHLHLSWMSPLKIRRMLIGGTRRMVVYDHLDPDNQVKVYDRGIDPVPTATRTTTPMRRLGDMVAPKVDQTEALEVMCRHFVECARARRTPISSGHAGLAVVRLVEAAQRSLEAGGKVIQV